eukprot:gb/GEZN01003760.1/.p1 GENE.gb/GEZN01003760.1/~~gb/GEZN01003760.1/.p1  ORF type:complete len:587 (-),score=65.07 gb/GEZN01003760.1/:324-2084(-)
MRLTVALVAAIHLALGETGGDREKLLAARREQVKEAFLTAWKSYEKHAWEHDELKPRSHSAVDKWGSYGVTAFEALDTMIIMGLATAEESGPWMQARTWVSLIDFEQDTNVRVFDMISAYAGSLLAAYTLTGDVMFLHRAKTLADHVEDAFTSNVSHPLPFSYLDMRTRKSSGDRPDLATIGGYSLEFRALSKVLKDQKYAKQADAVFSSIQSWQKNNKKEFNLLPMHWNATTGLPVNDGWLGVGAEADDYYQNLLKTWIQSGKTDQDYRLAYERAVTGIRNQLLAKSSLSGLTWVKSFPAGLNSTQFSQTLCYLPGLLALGSYGETDADLALAKELMETCYQTYKRNPSGLASDSIDFSEVGWDFLPSLGQDDWYSLPPQFISSLLYLYRITANETYQEWGWSIFEAIQAKCKVGESDGYTRVKGVSSESVVQEDHQPSAFTGAMLKYFFLLFSDPSVIPLDKYVFNHEGHVLPVFGASTPPLFPVDSYLPDVSWKKRGGAWDKLVQAALLVSLAIALVVIFQKVSAGCKEGITTHDVLSMEDDTELAGQELGTIKQEKQAPFELSDDEEGDLSDVPQAHASDDD